MIIEDRATSEDKKMREDIELEIAVDNKALYWNAYGKQRKLAKEYYKNKYALKWLDGWKRAMVSVVEKMGETLSSKNSPFTTILTTNR